MNLFCGCIKERELENFLSQNYSNFKKEVLLPYLLPKYRYLKALGLNIE